MNGPTGTAGSFQSSQIKGTRVQILQFFFVVVVIQKPIHFEPKTTCNQPSVAKSSMNFSNVTKAVLCDQKQKAFTPKQIINALQPLFFWSLQIKNTGKV